MDEASHWFRASLILSLESDDVEVNLEKNVVGRIGCPYTLCLFCP